jgi:hypothetical protein
MASWLWLMVLLLPTMAGAEGVPYSAIVLDISGQVTATHQGNRRSLELGALLIPQEVVETAPGSALTINYLESGEEEQWPGGLRFSVGTAQSDPVHPQVKRMNRKVVLPQLASPPGGLKLRGVSLERGSRTIGVLGLSNSATLEDRPTFAWGAIPGAVGYRVALYPQDGDKPVWQRTVKGTVMPYPQGEPLLKWGRHYVWLVEALRDGQVIAKKPSCFALPAQDAVSRLNEQKKSFAAQLASHPEDTPTRLAFIFFLEAHRLYDEAAAQYAILRQGRHDSQTLRNREARLMQIKLAPGNLMP